MKPDCRTFDKVLGAKIERVGRAAVDAMIKRHYIGRWPGVCVLILAMKIGEELLGVIVFALPPRETMKRYDGETWELARLWLDDAVPQNAETWLIAQAVRYIKKNHPTVRVLVSYADPSAGHAGTIYKAANWIVDGRTDQDRKSPRFDYADAATGKRYSRRGHVPEGVTIKRIPRVSKFRFIYRMVPPSQRPAGHNGVSTQYEALLLAALPVDAGWVLHYCAPGIRSTIGLALPTARVAVEIDWVPNMKTENFLMSRGFRIIPLSSEQVLSDLDGCVSFITAVAASSAAEQVARPW